MQRAPRFSWIQDFVRRHWGKLLIVQMMAVFTVGYLSASGSSEREASEVGEIGDAATQIEAGPSLWTCSMHPQIRQPNPGKCPICGMDLIPVAQTSGGLRTLTVSPEAKALMNVQTVPVERKYVQHEIRMVGKVDYDETKLGYITAWVSGRLDRLYADFTGVQVRKGDHMAYIYSEELYSAQEELIQARKYSAARSGRPQPNLTATGRIDLVESAREKLRLLGLKEEQIAQIETQDNPTNHVTIFAPVGGIVIEKLKQEGERVGLGERIYTIADLNQVWVHLDAYETDLPWIRYGQEVSLSTEAYPGTEFKGRIAFIQPVLNDMTRTVKVRVNVPNPDGKLKPDMFVHAIVRPMVASAGRVLDPSLAGKWISPMHPEIVKDEPGICDVCGMPLVRAETLGYVAADTNTQEKPLVIPNTAALVTGTRAVVYVELPSMHSRLEPAFQTLSSAAEEGNVAKIRQAFVGFGQVLDRPYDHPGTVYAQRLWSHYADSLAPLALQGQRIQSATQAKELLGELEGIMDVVREVFAPVGQPTFEGREIVLGPRAGDYYQVRRGLEEGELVVVQGSFKIDSEIQIQAKPSMMTPEGGGGGGHDHTGGGKKPSDGGQHAGHQMSLPPEFSDQLRQLDAAYDEVTKAVKQADLAAVNAAFKKLGQTHAAIDGGQLTGHPRTLWKEFGMLLGNDAVEGGEVEQLADADRVYLVLKSHMRRVREQFGVSRQQPRDVERITVDADSQARLAGIWQVYLRIQTALAADNLSQVRQALGPLEAAIAVASEASLDEHATHAWTKEQANLTKVLGRLQGAQDIEAMRAEFSLLSDEVGVLAKGFGFGDAGPIFQLHCPMAFQGRGATWYQDGDQARNPYYGSTMLKCADRIEKLTLGESSVEDQQQSHQGHSHP